MREHHSTQNVKAQSAKTQTRPEMQNKPNHARKCLAFSRNVSRIRDPQNEPNATFFSAFRFAKRTQPCPKTSPFVPPSTKWTKRSQTSPSEQNNISPFANNPAIMRLP